MKENSRDFKAFTHFLAAYKHQYDLNGYARTNYDEDLEHYLGYRPNSRYPLAYNEYYNKLLPKIMTILSRFMDQIYQAGTGELISVRPRKRSDVERAARVQGLLNYQLETLNDIDCRGGSYLFNLQWMFNAVTFGKGICKLYWRKEERITPRRITIPYPIFEGDRLVDVKTVDRVIKDMQTVYNGPYAEVIHNKLFVPHPHYKNIQQMPFVFCVYSKSIDYIRQKAKEGVYRNVKDLGWSANSNERHAVGTAVSGDAAERFAKSLEIEGGLSMADFESTRVSPNVDIIECYGRYIFPEDDAPYEVGSGVKIKGKESEAIAHIGNYKALLSLQKNEYGVRPFFDIGCYLQPEMFWDVGLIRIGKGIQEQYNTLANTRLQNAMMLVNQMIKVREDADIPQQSLIWKPYGIIPVEDMGDVEPLITPDVSQTGVFREQEQFFSETLDDMTGMYAYNQGQTPARQEHVGTMYSIQSMGEARTRLLLMTMDHTGFRPLLKHMMLLNTFHLPPEIEARINTPQGDNFTNMMPGDIHPDYDFSARYTAMEPALGKQFRAQQLIQYAQMWSESPFLQHHQFMKAILELLDFHDSDKYLKSPQQVQMEQQQQQQAMMAGAAFQDSIEAKKDERKLLGEMAKGLIQ